MKPKLTVLCLTYNQEKFVSQTLNGFIMQKTNFSYEVIISDDASQDKTPEIIESFAQEYPSIIKPILRQNNVGPARNWLEALNSIKSEYVLYTDGDDYFTDPYKLQKQVDYLDSHPECSICFHPVLVKWERNTEKDVNKDTIFPTSKFRFHKEMLTLDDLLQHNFIQTNSCMYRWRFNQKEQILDVFPDNIIPGDYFLHLLHAQKGKIGFIPDIMSVYRIHDGGIWNGSGKCDEWFVRYGISHIRFFEAVEKYFNVSKKEDKYFFVKKILEIAFKTRNFNLLQQIFDNFSEYAADIFKQETIPNNFEKYTRKYKKYKKNCYILVILIIVLIILFMFIL